MMDLIDRQVAIDAIRCDPMGGLNYARILKDLPTVDAVEVVRCKDCRYFQGDGFECARGIYCFEDDYCSMGVRREGNE